MDVIKCSGPGCDRAATLACSRCRAACFCSSACQRSLAPRHSSLCASLAGLTRYATWQQARQASARPLYSATVVHVADGDTLTVSRETWQDAADLKVSARGVSVRFDGVDAPEIAHANMRVAKSNVRGKGKGKRSRKQPGQPGGEQARALIELLAPEGAHVLVGRKPGTESDKYRRLVADLWVQQPDGSYVWLQEALLYAGRAWRYADYDADVKRGTAPAGEQRRAARLDTLEKDARKAAQGLWRCLNSEGEPMRPSEWRRASPEERREEVERWQSPLQCARE